MTRLAAQLDRVRRLDRSLDRRRRVARAASAWLAALWLAVAFDAGWSMSAGADADAFAVYELPVAVRLVVAGVLAAGLVAVAMSLRIARRLRRATEADYALRCERSMRLPVGALVSAVQLAAVGGEGGGLRGVLIERAVVRGDEAASAIAAERVIDRAPARRAVRGLIVVVAFWLVTAAIALALPGRHPYAVGLARLVLPTADVPAYSFVTIDVAVTPRPVAIGDTVTLAAATNDTMARPMRVRFADGSTMPVSAGDAGATLGSVTDPVRVVIEGAHTRSRAVTITPVLLPEAVSFEVEASHPDGRRVALRPPIDRTARVLIGATVTVTAHANRPDAVIDDADASGATLRFSVEPGVREVALRLATPDGLRSRTATVMRFEGLSPGELAALNDRADPGSAPLDEGGAGLIASADALGATALAGDDAGAIAARLQTGTPTDGVGEGDGGSASEQPGDGAGAGDAGDGGLGSGGTSGAAFDETAYFDRVERQLVQRAGLSAEQVAAVRGAIDRAPRAYRRLTAEYFLRISIDSAAGER